MQESKSHIARWLAGSALLGALTLAGCTQYGGKNPESLPMEREATTPQSTNSEDGGRSSNGSNTPAKTPPAKP